MWLSVSFFKFHYRPQDFRRDLWDDSVPGGTKCGAVGASFNSDFVSLEPFFGPRISAT